MAKPILNVLEKVRLIRQIQRLRQRTAELENLFAGRQLGVANFVDAAITNAKIVSLEADKITAGDLVVAVDVGNPSSGYIRFDGDNDRIVINDGTTNRIVLDPTTFRVSLPGINALTNTDPKNFSVYADSDNVLIKEKARGSSDVATDPTYTHSLTYIPFYLVMGKISSSKYRVANAYIPQAGVWLNYCDTSKIYFNAGASAYDDYLYYVFYDDF